MIETLTEEQERFLHGQALPLPPTVDSGNAAPKIEPQVEAVGRVRRAATHLASKRPAQRASTARVSYTGEIARLRRATQSVTLRLQSPIARMLRRVAIERSLEYVEPFTQQAIVENAVRNWLETAGYSLDE